MLKKLAFILLFYLSLNPIFSQAFDYERTWGTYYGPAGNIFDVHTANGGFIVDPQNNLHLLGQIDMNNGLSASYYNQYVTPGGQGVVMNVIGNLIQTKFDSNGSLLTSEYTGHSSVSSTEEHLVHIDVIGNYYYIKEKLDAITDPATSNTWFSTDPIISIGNNISHQLLIKKNNSGNIAWKTFFPSIASKLNSTASDENGNVYVYSNTFLQQGIGTPGSFMQNYQTKLR